MSDFEERFEELRQAVDEAIEDYCISLKMGSEVLRDSVKYALLGGGKRVRPVLFLAAGDLMGLYRDDIMPLALSIELIHNYSLIHDDIMDGDDYRRGMPTVQKKFGTSNALLAGDALLNDAHTLMLSHCEKHHKDVSACRFISSCAGGEGMIAGQSEDLLHEGDEIPDKHALDFIYSNKTAKLIAAACAAPCRLPSRNSGKYFYTMYDYGKNLGMLFQLTDDLLDCSSEGSDAKRKKCTAVSLYGVEECEKLKKKYAENALLDLNGVYIEDTSFFKDFVKYVEERKA